jgi:nucleotide-binding universal stress UspA family protein
MPFTILVPTDFSSTAERAFVYALNIASKNNDTVFLYNVFTPIENMMAVKKEMRDEYNLQNEQYLMKSLNDLKDKWQSEYSNVKIIVDLGISPLVSSIVNFAHDNDVNLIVMGTLGASGIKKAIIGTNAAAVLKKAAIPLLLVPDEFNWIIPRKMVMLTNYQKEDIEALTLVGKLANMYDAAIEVVHLCEQNINDMPEIQDEFTRHINLFKVKFPESTFTSSLLPASNITNMLECLHDLVPYDLLVMVRHKMSLPEHFYTHSHTRQMACLTKYPLLVIPARD